MRISDWSSDVCSSDLRSIRFFSPERGGGEIAQRLADARPRFGKEHVGLIAVRARGEAGGRRLSIGALTRPLLCPLPSQTAEAIRHFLVIPDRKITRLNSSHKCALRIPSSSLKKK